MTRANQVVVNLGEAESSSDIHERLMQALGFPEWYGRNWDAFWDSITGLVEMPRALRFEGWADFEARLPCDAQLMKQCLAEMSAKYPEAAVSVEFA